MPVKTQNEIARKKELEQKLQLEIQEQRRLVELDEVKTHYFTNISHEFRTPLTIILGLADSLLTQVNTRMQNKLEIIQRNGQQLLRMVNQMLAFKQLEATPLVQPIQSNIIPYLKTVVNAFHFYAISKKVNIHFESQCDEIIMDYDPEKIEIICSNLLSNALKFSKHKGLVKVLVKKISGTSSALCISVEDNGPGIPKEELGRIFDRFYQINSMNNNRQTGTGIGLALTKELVTLLKGTIDVESTLGTGSTFTVYLPIERKAQVSTSFYYKTNRKTLPSNGTENISRPLHWTSQRS